jgi:hypothetical protein
MPCGTLLLRIRLVLPWKQEAITRSPLQDVQFAAMVKINLRLQGTVGQLAGQVAAATAAA